MAIRLLSGDCRDVLPTLPADSVQCVVCSPPYYGLRDYGTALWDGGDAQCDHANGRQGATRRDVSPERLAERAALYGTGTGAGSDVPPQQFRDTCGKCGAVRIDRSFKLPIGPCAEDHEHLWKHPYDWLWKCQHCAASIELSIDRTELTVISKYLEAD